MHVTLLFCPLATLWACSLAWQSNQTTAVSKLTCECCRGLDRGPKSNQFPGFLSVSVHGLRAATLGGSRYDR